MSGHQSCFLLKTCSLFTLSTDEISPMHCSDFQHEGSSRKIFTCCQEVNKQPLLACWDQSKAWAKDMKAYDSMWLVGGVFGLVWVYACLLLRVYMCVNFPIERTFPQKINNACIFRAWVYERKNKLVSKELRASAWPPADLRSYRPLPQHLFLRNEENMAISNRIATLQSKHALVIMFNSQPSFEKCTHSYFPHIRLSFSP